MTNLARVADKARLARWPGRDRGGAMRLGLFDRFWNSAHAVLTDGNLDVGRPCGGIAYVGGRDFACPAHAIALAWSLLLFLVLVFHHSVTALPTAGFR